MTQTDAGRGTPFAGRTAFVHLLVLWAFSAVQPTLSVLDDSVDYFFPSRRIEGLPFVLTLVALVVIPPAVLWGAGELIGRWRSGLRRTAHLVAIGGMAVLFATYALDGMTDGGIVPVLAGPALGVGFTWLYARHDALQQVVGVLAPAPVVFLVVFALFTNVSHLVFGDEGDVADIQASRPAPVVVLVLDELPTSSLMTTEEKLDVARWPGIGALASDATWYRRATTSSDTTLTSLPAILSGQLTDNDQLPLVFDHPQNLFTLLGRSYDEHVMESFTRLCPLSLCPNDRSTPARMLALASAMSVVFAEVVLPDAISIDVPDPGNTLGTVLKAKRPRTHIDPFGMETGDLRLFPGPQFDRFLSEMKPVAPADKPPLFFLHSSLPHIPYRHLPSGRVYQDPYVDLPGLDRVSENWTGAPGPVIAGLQRHLAQLRFADRLVGRMVQRLKQAGLYDDALIILVSDHGASFQPRGNRRSAGERSPTLPDIAMVPMIVKLPGQTDAAVSDAPVSNLDVVPTVADVVGARPPWRMDGRSVRTVGRDDRRELSMLRLDGRRIQVDPQQLAAARRRTLEVNETLFGHGGEPGDLYGFAVTRPYMGKARAALELGAPIGAEVRLDDPDDLRDVELDSPYLPALVEGTVSGPVQQVQRIMVLLNGVVAGSGLLSERDGKAAFSVLLDESRFREGENTVEVVALVGDGRALQVRPLQRR